MCENVLRFNKTKEELLKEGETLYVVITTKNGLWYAVSSLCNVNEQTDDVREAILEHKEGIPLFPTKELCLAQVRAEAVPFENIGIKVKVFTVMNQEL